MRKSEKIHEVIFLILGSNDGVEEVASIFPVFASAIVIVAHSNTSLFFISIRIYSSNNSKINVI